MATTVIHIRDSRPDDIYIGRAGHNKDGYFGNPFPLKKGDPRGSTISKYKAYFLERINSDSTFRERVLALKDKRLVCFCKPHPCHGDVIAEWVDSNS